MQAFVSRYPYLDMNQLFAMTAYFRELNELSVLLRFLLAMLLGAVVGAERGKRQRAAGLRTHILVCMGAASVMMVSQYIGQYLKISTDPARLGAQVISGIGFLGAGTIITGRQQVMGLTTAAGLWASACMGLAVGIGFYEGAVFLCAMLYFVLEMLSRLERRYLKTEHCAQIYLELQPQLRFGVLLTLLRNNGCRVFDLRHLETNPTGFRTLSITVDCESREMGVETALLLLRESEGVICAERI